VRGERGSKAIAKTQEVLASVGLTAKMTAIPRELSGGERQRVAIARAIVAKPSAILAHEPTASLDSANGHTTMTILSTIAKEGGRAVLLVTHDARLFEFADRIVHIEDGALTQEELGDTSSTARALHMHEGVVIGRRRRPRRRRPFLDLDAGR
jgi:putative ABC transport system ATP-binding protein